MIVVDQELLLSRAFACILDNQSSHDIRGLILAYRVAR
jgi:hypothetical protein